MNWLLLIIGVFFLLEGGANLAYWHLYPKTEGELWFWEVGRAIRTILGLILIGVAL